MRNRHQDYLKQAEIQQICRLSSHPPQWSDSFSSAKHKQDVDIHFRYKLLEIICLLRDAYCTAFPKICVAAPCNYPTKLVVNFNVVKLTKEAFRASAVVRNTSSTFGS